MERITRKRYSTQLKQQVVDAVRNGLTLNAAARQFNISYTNVQRWCQINELTERQLDQNQPHILDPERQPLLNPHVDDQQEQLPPPQNPLPNRGRRRRCLNRGINTLSNFIDLAENE